VNCFGLAADTCEVPYQPETSYFVRLDTPPPVTRHTQHERERHWSDTSAPPPPHRRRKRYRVRPAGILVLIPIVWLGWAYTTPGGPSARISHWIDQTRTDVADVSASPSLRQTAIYFNGLYATQGSYPNLSDSALQAEPTAGFGLSMTFTWCSPRDVVIQSPSAGGTISKLLVDGKDVGNVVGASTCPVNLAHPAPWKIDKSAK
jgi:hypothetical protein